MKVLYSGDIFRGKNYADMINNAIGANYRGYQQSSVNMKNFGEINEVISWFVYMDGSVHGYGDGWQWKNCLSPDLKEIREYNVSASKEKLYSKYNKRGYLPYRLSFQLDPYAEGVNNCCKFVGAFALESFLSEDLSAIKYKKVADNFVIGSKGETLGNINNMNDFRCSDKYKRKIEEFNFSESDYRMLKGVGVVYMYELLEFEGLSEYDSITAEIRRNLYKCFCDK